MTKHALIDSARRLPAPSPPAATEYAARVELLSAEVTRTLRERSDLDALIGPGNAAMMEQNHRNHARFMSNLLGAFDPEVLVETILWVFRAYRGHGFHLTYWPAQLDTWLVVLEDRLPADACREVRRIYDWMLVHQAAFAALSEPEARGEEAREEKRERDSRAA
ncbi:MAG: hypothetical protein GF330_02070 [Candidatus Eisenbacteria bacterium]|nr:hypothetical protein [Candidatus Eisenbacteria bacterium]